MREKNEWRKNTEGRKNVYGVNILRRKDYYDDTKHIILQVS